MNMTPSPEPEKAVPVVAYLRATRDGKPVWGEGCVCQDPVYPSDPEGSDADCISMSVVRGTDHESAMAALRAEVERLRADAVDARRYRWLRVGGIGRAGVYLNGWKEGNELDASIDTAITAAHGAQGDSNAE